jgi:HlyD family secretion protein
MNSTHLLLLLPGPASSCAWSEPSRAGPMRLDPAVKVVHARPRTVVRTVQQPGVIGAYERTALYAKVFGFVQRWNVDIGDRVKAGATLVELNCSAANKLQRVIKSSGVSS